MLQPRKWKVWLFDPWRDTRCATLRFLGTFNQLARERASAHAVNPLRFGPVRINLYNYYDAHRRPICVYRVAAPLEGSPIGRKLVYFFVVPPRGAPHRLTFETPGYYRWNAFTCVCARAPPYATGPTETSYVDPFSGPVDPYTCARYPRKREGREASRGLHTSRIEVTTELVASPIVKFSNFSFEALLNKILPFKHTFYSALLSLSACSSAQCHLKVLFFFNYNNSTIFLYKSIKIQIFHWKKKNYD